MAAREGMTPEQRTQRARAAALSRWANEDPTAQTLKLQAGIRAKFEREVDPEGKLAPAERARRAEAARKAHLARLALKSSRVRAARQSNPAA
jgi:hypothetical protein